LTKTISRHSIRVNSTLSYRHTCQSTIGPRVKTGVVLDKPSDIHYQRQTLLLPVLPSKFLMNKFVIPTQIVRQSWLLQQSQLSRGEKAGSSGSVQSDPIVSQLLNFVQSQNTTATICAINTTSVM
jgi:hypothetical protein